MDLRKRCHGPCTIQELFTIDNTNSRRHNKPTIYYNLISTCRKLFRFSFPGHLSLSNFYPFSIIIQLIPITPLDMYLPEMLRVPP